MLAIGVYNNGGSSTSIKTKNVAVLDSRLIRADFLRTFGREPSKVILIKNGDPEPVMIAQVYPEVSSGGWGYMVAGIAMCFVGLAFVFSSIFFFMPYLMICATIAVSVALGLVIYSKRYDNKRLLKDLYDYEASRDANSAIADLATKNMPNPLDDIRKTLGLPPDEEVWRKEAQKYRDK